MRTVIAGSRDIQDAELVLQAIAESGFSITEVVSGTARGVDTLGEQWALENEIPIKRFPADWNANGKGAGAIRNYQMAEYAAEDPNGGQVIVIIRNKSKGSQNMIWAARSKKLKLYVKEVA